MIEESRSRRVEESRSEVLRVEGVAAADSE